jgi:hypothetical protein
MASRSYIPCPQWRVVNLLHERGIGGDLARDANRFVGTDEFHKRPFYLELTVPDLRRNQEPSPRGGSNGHLAVLDSGLGLDLEIALSGASARLRPPQQACQNRLKVR